MKKTRTYLTTEQILENVEKEIATHTHEYTNGTSCFTGSFDECESMQSYHRRMGWYVKERENIA